MNILITISILFAPIIITIFINLTWGATETNNLVNNNSTLSMSRLPPPVETITESSPQPSPLSEEERFSMFEELEDVNQVPDLPIANTSVTGPTNGTETNSTDTSKKNNGSSILEPISIEPKAGELRLRVIKNTSLTPIDVGYVLETSVASVNKSIFYTGNLFAANSFDDGSTWKYLNIKRRYENRLL